MENLTTIKQNKFYKVVGFDDSIEKNILRRFCDFGITKGQKIKVNYKSLLKKVILIEIRGYTLSIKSSLASKVLVELW